MDIISKRHKDILVVSLIGELDHHHAGEIRDKLDGKLEDSTIKHLIFDLKELHFMDSSGIGVFIGRYKIINKREGLVCITQVNSQLAKIMDVSGLYKILRVYDSIEAAIDGIRREQ